MIALYRPGRSVVHRLPAGVKLAVLACCALAAPILPRTVWSGIGMLVFVCAAFAAGGFGPREWLRQIWLIRWIVVLMAVTQVFFLTPVDAVVNTARVTSLILLAALLTLTTRMDDLLDVLHRLLMPLRRVGVDPWRVGLMLSLTIAAVPVVADLSRRVREAQRARGVRLGVHALVTLFVLALRHADNVADALTARGIDEATAL